MNSKLTKTPSVDGKPLSLDVPPKSILKKEHTSPQESVSKLQLSNSNSRRSVKFKKSKDVEQVRLRSKLNKWLESKGRTPSRCHHLMCFDEELSAKKKRSISLQGRLSSDLLGNHNKALKREVDKSVKKTLFKEENKVEIAKTKTTPLSWRCENNRLAKKEDNIKRRSLNQEDHNCRKRTKFFQDKTNQPSKSPLPRAQKVKEDGHDTSCGASHSISKPTETRGTTEIRPAKPLISESEIQENLVSMLQECTTLLRAGCPAENILPWLNNMELYIPQTHSSALFYACKAEVFADSPLKMLQVFCQGVENCAAPSRVLSDAMKNLLSPHLSTPTNPQLVTVPSSLQSNLEEDLDSDQVIQGGSVLDSVSQLVKPSSLTDATQKLSGFDAESDCLVTTEGIKYSNPEPFNMSGKTTLSMRRRQGDSDTFDFGKGRFSHHTPVEKGTVLSEMENSCEFGSTIKYAVSSVTPIPGQSPESVPRSVLTPVRRSNRLSNRHVTPQSAHEIDSLMDLTLREAETVMYKSNPALTDTDN